MDDRRGYIGDRGRVAGFREISDNKYREGQAAGRCNSPVQEPRAA